MCDYLIQLHIPQSHLNLPQPEIDACSRRTGRTQLVIFLWHAKQWFISMAIFPPVFLTVWFCLLVDILSGSKSSNCFKTMYCRVIEQWTVIDGKIHVFHFLGIKFPTVPQDKTTQTHLQRFLQVINVAQSCWELQCGFLGISVCLQ